MQKEGARMSENVRLHKSSMLALLGAIIATISPILPWATIAFKPISIPGYYPYYQPQYIILPTLNIPASGFETIIYPTFASFLLVVVSIALFTTDEKRQMARGLFIVGAGFIMLMTYLYAISAASIAAGTVHDYYMLFASLLNIPLAASYWPDFSIAMGGFVAILGALITIVAGVWAFREKSYTENRTSPNSSED